MPSTPRTTAGTPPAPRAETVDTELLGIGVIVALFDHFTDDTRRRVLAYITARYGLAERRRRTSSPASTPGNPDTTSATP